jgi:hypothetical protein
MTAKAAECVQRVSRHGQISTSADTDTSATSRRLCISERNVINLNSGIERTRAQARHDRGAPTMHVEIST